MESQTGLGWKGSLKTSHSSPCHGLFVQNIFLGHLGYCQRLNLCYLWLKTISIVILLFFPHNIRLLSQVYEDETKILALLKAI